MSHPDREQTPPPQARRKLRRRRRVLLLLALLALIIGWGIRLRLDDWAREEIEVRLSALLGGHVRIGDLRLNLLSLGVDFERFEARVVRDGVRTLDASVKSGRIRVSWLGLIRLANNRIGLAEVRLHEPRIYIEQTTDTSTTTALPDTGDLTLAIDRLQVTEGEFGFADQRIPLELAASSIEVQAVWGGYLRTLEGHAAFEFALLHEPFVEPLALFVDTGFRWRGNDVELDGFSAVGSGLVLSVDARANWERGLQFEGQGRLDADLAPLRRLMDPELDTMEGSLALDFSVSHGVEPLAFEGRLRAGRVRYGPLQLVDLESPVTFSGGRLDLPTVTAGAMGGRVAARLEVQLESPVGFSAHADATGLDLGALLRTVELPLPLAGTVDAQADLAGDPGDLASWLGNGSFEISASRREPERLPLAANGTVQLEAGRISIDTPEAQLAATRTTVMLSIPLGDTPGGSRLVADGTTTSVDRLQQAVLQVLEAVEDTPPPEILLEPLTGAGTVRAELELGDVQWIAVDVDLADGSFAGETFERAQVGLELRGEQLTFHHVEVSEGPQRLVGSALLELEPFRIRQLDLDASGVDPSWILESLELPSPVGARLEGSVRVNTTASGLQGGGDVQLHEGAWLGERFDLVQLGFRVEDDRIVVERALWSGPSIDAAGSGEIDLAAAGSDDVVERVDFDVERLQVDLDSLDLLRDAELPLTGGLGGRGEIRLRPEGWSGGLTLGGQEWSLYGIPLGDVTGDLRLDDHRILGRLSSGSGLGWSVDASLGTTGEQPIDVVLGLDGTLLDFGDVLVAESAARLGGSVRLRGALATPDDLELDGQLDSVELRLGPRTFSARGPTPINYFEGVFEIGPLALAHEERIWSTRVRYDTRGHSILAESNGELDVGLLSLLVPEMRASGTAAIDIRVQGDPGRPRLGGSVSVDDGRLRVLGFPLTFEQIAVELELDGDVVRIERLDGALGGGSVAGSGELRLDGLGLDFYRVDFDVESVRLELPEDFEGIYRGELSVSGDEDRTRLGGSMEMIRGLYEVDFDLADLITSRAREYSASEEDDLGDKIHLDVQIVAQDNLWVRNNLAEVESLVDVHLGGTIDDPEVTGRIATLEGGKLEFQNVEYEIESASVDFLELGRMDPYLTVQARTQVSSYDVFLRVEGKLDDFEYELTSSPTLSQQDIIALLSTGRTLEELTGGSGTAEFTGDLAKNYFASALSGRFERQLQSALGLDRIQINPLAVEGTADPTTRVTVGKEVADDVLIVFSTEIGSEQRQIYQVEWRASRHYQVTLQQDTRFGTGGQIQYTNRFWWRRPPKVSEPDSPSPASRPDPRGPTEPVGSVTISGVGSESWDDLRTRIPLQAGEPFDRSDMFRGVENLRRHYVKQDRITADIRATADTGEAGAVHVTYSVDPGPVIRVELEGVTDKERRKLRRQLQELWLKSLFVEDIYSDTVNLVRIFFQRRGFFAVDVQSDLRDDGKERVLTVVVDRGKPVWVESVAIEGAEEIPEDRIRKQMLTRPPSVFSRTRLRVDVLEEDLRAIRNLGLDLGYLQVKLESRIRLSSDGNRARITVLIAPGPRYTIGELQFPEDIAFSKEQLQLWSGFEVGQVFSPSALLEAESALRLNMDREGYPDARAAADVTLRGQQAVVAFEVTSGGRQVLGAVEIEGNFWTRDKVIRRELEMRPGDTISRDKLLRFQHRLYKLGAFRNVRIRLSPMDEQGEEQRLVVEVQESKPVRFVVGVGYDTEEKFKTTLTVRHDNVAGRGRVLGFSGQLSGIRRVAQLNFEERRLFGEKLPTLATVGWQQLEFDGFTVRQNSAAFRVSRKFTPKWAGFIRYNFQRVLLLDVDIKGTEGFEDTRLGDVGLHGARVTRDDIFLTHSGSSLLLETRFFAKIFGSEETFVKPTAAYAHFLPLGPPGVFASSVRAGFAIPYGSTEGIPVSERFFAGGSNTLRGFQLNEVRPLGGESQLLFNLEYRAPVWNKFWALMFYDAGNIWEKVDGFDPTDLRHVAGLGIRWETPIGPLRLEYGWKLDRQPGETSGEVYFAIGEPF